MTQIIDLTTIAPPDVVEELDFEAIYQELLTDFRALYPEWTASIESDPVVKLLELAAYREMLLRARINDAAQSNLLAFAAGGDLDQLAAFYGVVRQNDELDDRLRLRTQLRIAALAGNGTREHYRVTALSASPDVVDAAILQPSAGAVDIAVWLREGAAQSTAMDAVRTALHSDETRIVGVPIAVRLAKPRPVSFRAVLYRESTAPVNLVPTLAERMPGAIAGHARLGRDIARSWLMSVLHGEGISSVDLQFDDLAIAADEYPVAGQIGLMDGGVRW